MSGASPNFVYACEQWEIDLGRQELRSRGIPVPLGSRAFEIVGVLVQSASELVTKDHLMERVWHGAVVGEGTLHVHISAVRKALGADRGLLKTSAGRGYRLLGTWTPLHSETTAAPLASQPVAPQPVAPQPVRAPEATPANNFPLIVGPLVGRAEAARHVRDLVSAYRVVTLTGPGGIGKTTLAIKAARSLLADFDGGAWLVELASLSDPGLVPSAVAGALGLKLGGDDEISADSLARTVGTKHFLLVLDNCEHVIDAVASLAETVVRLCPRATILATSREVLRIDGEAVYRVPPLDVPAPGQDAPDHILGHSAVELFFARMKAMGAGFSPRTEELASVAAICRRLDGIPLAIEFAAARAAVLGIQQVAVDLRDRFALLTGRRTALPRHRTLRAALDWSHELLPEAERRLLRRLASFPAGFTADAAAIVMKDTGLDPSAVIEGIANLVTKSLVALDKSENASRWHLLDTIRAYALEKLVEHGEADIVARHHAAYFRDLFALPASDPSARLWTGDLTRRVREIDNVRAALDWSFSDPGDRALGIDLTAAYAPVWLSLSLMAECRERCERALLAVEQAAAPNPPIRMWLQIALGSALIVTMGHAAQARELLTKALETADELDDLDAQARALTGLLTASVYHGEHGRARAAVKRIGQIAERLGDPAFALVADRLTATTLLTVGRLPEAQHAIERVLQSRVPPENRRRPLGYATGHRASDRAMLSRALWLRGSVAQAHHEALASLDELGPADHQLLICRVLYVGICRIAPMTGDFAAAERANARLIEVATRLNASFWKTAGRFLEGKLMVERGDFANGSAALRDAFNICRQTGWRMSYPEFKGSLAVALAGLGQLDEALDAVNEGLEGSGQSDDGQRWYVPELLRIKGDITLRSGAADAAAAADYFLEALRIAREQGALFWELRAALSLARLLATQGRHDAARQTLAPVHDRFTEGFGTADLRAAKALLDTLTR